MKLIVYILLIQFTIGSLMPRCDFSQLARVSYLIEHYELHKKEAELLGQTMSFGDFFYLHFISCEEHSHETGETHENLPFKEITSSIVLDLSQIDLSISFEPFQNFSQNFDLKLLADRIDVTNIFHPPSL